LPEGPRTLNGDSWWTRPAADLDESAVAPGDRIQ
jgi:hypothetical protein